MSLCIHTAVNNLSYITPHTDYLPGHGPLLQDCVWESAPLNEEHGKPPFTGATHDLDLSCVPSPPQDTEHSDHSLQDPQAALTVSDPIFEEIFLLCKFQWCIDMLVPNDVHIQYMTYRLCNNQYPTIHHNRTIIHLHNLSCCRNHLHPVHTCWSCCNLLKYLIVIFDWKMIFYDILCSVL